MKPPTPFAVRVNGAPYDDYAFKPAAAKITYSMEYELEMARVFAGLSIDEWANLPGTREWVIGEGRCKCDILILYRMSNFIPAASSDAQVREMERQAKLKGRR